MMNTDDVLARVRSAARIGVFYLPHAVRQMLRPERMITIKEVQQVIATGILIENYPEDPRGHSCLIAGRGDGGRPVHIVCAPRQDFLAVITAYIPDSDEWSKDFTARIKK